MADRFPPDRMAAARRLVDLGYLPSLDTVTSWSLEGDGQGRLGVEARVYKRVRDEDVAEVYQLFGYEVD